MTKVINGYRVAKGDEDTWKARQEPQTTTVGVESPLAARVAELEERVRVLEGGEPAESDDEKRDEGDEPAKRPTARKVETK